MFTSQESFPSCIFPGIKLSLIKFQATRKAKEKHSLRRLYLTNEFSLNSQFWSVATFIATLDLNRKTD